MGYCLIAHNAKGFDAVLIQRWLFQNRPTADMHVIHSGQKIIQLTLKDYEIRLIGSLNFLQMPLSKFPETFGLDLASNVRATFPSDTIFLRIKTTLGLCPVSIFTI